jgi:glyoxylase-like metal-dependent hydrolase (beta-lactamase superfamily II)
MADDSISVEELQELLASGESVTVVDIRSPKDRDWSIPGSLQVDAYDAVKSGSLGPLAALDLPRAPVVTVCGVGRTAAAASKLLRARGVKALTLSGGMRAWSLAWNTAEMSTSGSDIVQVRRTGKGCLSYIVASDGEAVVIDASLDPDVYMRLIRERGWRLVAVVETHIHADHLSRSRLLAGRAGVEVWIPAQKRAHFGFRSLNDRDRIRFGSKELVALHTPGHTAESTTYVLEDTAAFTGDTLFLAGVGRPDLEGGSTEEWSSRTRVLYRSIRRVLELSPATLLLPAHVAEPVPFDCRLLSTTVGAISSSTSLAQLPEDEFVAAILARIPPTPPNHNRIVELNERGEVPEDPTTLEAGANRCAVA